MRGIASYRNVALESSDQRQLVVLCFETLVRRQVQAKSNIEDGKLIDANEDLRVCREIFCELLLALDEEASPELSGNLSQLYDFCIRELVAAGAERSLARIDGSLEVTRLLHRGFSAAFEGEPGQ
jgi:flagellar biosynthetic protein FliS